MVVYIVFQDKGLKMGTLFWHAGHY
uniref:Uncharacterized protein n=1 Tax=Anguilla anguilla TaxID=7936 RepID=A0A0E9U0R3_ANGAN